ncbi:MAG: hypothetical protein V4819_20045 [Verrucomicrobiota bacterium]
MLPQGPEYLVQYACFVCRKSFKRAVQQQSATCPNCGAIAYMMGRNFKAPNVSDDQQWKKVEILYQGGVRFWGTQSYEKGKFPDTIDEAKAFLERNKATIQAQWDRYRSFLAEDAKRDERFAEKRRRLKPKRLGNADFKSTDH